MRFHLPAFMLADLDGQLNTELLYYLTQSSVKEEKFALMNAAQRTIVIDYLNLRLDDEDFSHEWEHISNALLGYWNE